MNPKELRQHTLGYNILYVEDDANLRAATAKLFGQFFSTVDVADDGLMGLTLFEKNRYDLVITDVNMPHMNGVEMIRRIRALKPDQTILVTSAHSDADNLMALLDLGIDKFIVKPLNLHKLVDALIHLTLYIEHKSTTTQAIIRPLQERIESLEQELSFLRNQPIVSTPKSDYMQSRVHALTTIHETLFSLLISIQMENELSTANKEHLSDLIAALIGELAAFGEAKMIVKLLGELGQKIQLQSSALSQHAEAATTAMEEIFVLLLAWYSNTQTQEQIMTHLQSKLDTIEKLTK